ncbi:hypothetical protein, partial [Marinobacterium sp. xm-d-509]|uniref:hypothetical protein n=1 Tax=Marinobacterium sp. xm-d-509 TaxID=2497739 RepID=UPI001C2BE59B
PCLSRSPSGHLAVTSRSPSGHVMVSPLGHVMVSPLGHVMVSPLGHVMGKRWEDTKTPRQTASTSTTSL